jgi:hypothetical protein
MPDEVEAATARWLHARRRAMRERREAALRRGDLDSASDTSNTTGGVCRWGTSIAPLRKRETAETVDAPERHFCEVAQIRRASYTRYVPETGPKGIQIRHGQRTPDTPNVFQHVVNAVIGVEQCPRLASRDVLSRGCVRTWDEIAARRSSGFHPRRRFTPDSDELR